MATHRISGVWKDTNNVITHYAIHKINNGSITRAQKYTKLQAIALLETPGVSSTTLLWNYQNSFWQIGENVKVVNGHYGKYLRTDPDNTRTDNLAHLIDYDWVSF